MGFSHSWWLPAGRSLAAFRLGRQVELGDDPAPGFCARPLPRGGGRSVFNQPIILPEQFRCHLFFTDSSASAIGGSPEDLAGSQFQNLPLDPVGPPEATAITQIGATASTAGRGPHFRVRLRDRLQAQTAITADPEGPSNGADNTTARRSWSAGAGCGPHHRAGSLRNRTGAGRSKA